MEPVSSSSKCYGETPWYQRCKGRREPPDVDVLWIYRKKCLDQDLLISFTTNRVKCPPHLQTLTNFAFLNCVVSASLLMSPIVHVCMQAVCA